MKTKYDNSKQLNKLLQFLLDNEGKKFGPDKIIEKLFPELDFETIHIWFETLITEKKVGDETAVGFGKQSKSSYLIWAISETKLFVQSGGFKESSVFKVKKFVYNPYTITLVCGLILLYFGNQIWPSIGQRSGIPTIINEKKYIRPNIRLEPYRIYAENKAVSNLDTVTITFRYMGSDVVISDDFKLVNYKFTELKYFYMDTELIIEPEVELIEPLVIENILDSASSVIKIALQLKRKTIFDGFDMAYVEQHDKQSIGSLDVEYSFSYNGEITTDTISTKIYLEKPPEN